MQHDVLPKVLEALSGVEPGEAHPCGSGLRLVSLRGRGPAAAEPGAGVAGGDNSDALEWRELSRPEPGRVRVRNSSDRMVVVDPCVLLESGMSMRALPATKVIGPNAETTISVEPLGARWWFDGPLRRGGRLLGLSAALLLQSAHGGDADRHSARAALWDLFAAEEAGSLRGDQVPLSPRAGWAVVADDGVLAVWIRWRGSRTDADRVPTAAPPRQTAPGDELMARIVRAIERGGLAAHLVGESGADGEVVIVPPGLTLADRAIAASSAAVATSGLRR